MLERHPEVRHAVVRYEDLVASPKATVETVYDQLGLPLAPEFEKVALTQKRQGAASFSLRLLVFSSVRRVWCGQSVFLDRMIIMPIKAPITTTAKTVGQEAAHSWPISKGRRSTEPVRLI